MENQFKIQNSAFKIIIISSPDSIPNEAEKIQSLFDAGIEIIHLRKPDWTKEALLGLIKSVNPRNLKKLVIHSHYELIEQYNLKGIHFTEKYRNGLSDLQLKGLATVLKRKGMTFSTSFHRLKDLNEQGNRFDYAFLSPVFDSISKQNYPSNFNLEKLKSEFQTIPPSTKVFALGGITAANISQLDGIGFEGVALGNYRVL
jgi:thiamine-phosphate pyrophosphorylase